MFLAPVRMHIPDGILSTAVSISLWILSALAVAVALRRAGRDLGEREVPLMGVLAAAIFAGQMLNFTIAGGSSGHLLGAALATILLGPWAAVLVMTSVVVVQAIIFQDGGILALGANLFNMAVVGVAVSYFVYRIFQRIFKENRIGIFAGSFAAAWCSIFVAALAAGLQIALSGTSPANIAVPAMAGIHALIGIGEGLITLGAISFLYAARRDLLKIGQPQPVGGRVVFIAGIGLAILLAVLSPLASTNPDGFETVAEKAGFLAQAQAPSFTIVPDYLLPGVSNATAATILAGVLGVVIVLAVSLGVAWSRRKRSHSQK